MTVGKAVDAILGAFLLLTISLGGIGQARAQTSP